MSPDLFILIPAAVTLVGVVAVRSPCSISPTIPLRPGSTTSRYGGWDPGASSPSVSL